MDTMIYMANPKEKKSFYVTSELREAFEDTLQSPHEGSVHAGAALFLYLAAPSALKALARDYSGRPDVKQAIREFLDCLEKEGLAGPNSQNMGRNPDQGQPTGHHPAGSARDRQHTPPADRLHRIGQNPLTTQFRKDYHGILYGRRNNFTLESQPTSG